MQTQHQRRIAAQTRQMLAMRRADKLPDDSNFYTFMATGAFDPPTQDDNTVDTNEVTAMTEAFQRAGGSQ